MHFLLSRLFQASYPKLEPEQWLSSAVNARFARTTKPSENTHERPASSRKQVTNMRRQGKVRPCGQCVLVIALSMPRSSFYIQSHHTLCGACRSLCCASTLVVLTQCRVWWRSSGFERRCCRIRPSLCASTLHRSSSWSVSYIAGSSRGLRAGQGWTRDQRSEESLIHPTDTSAKALWR